MGEFTIVDIARLADVSTATVSRVINNNYPVSKKVRDKVEAVIKANNFSLNNNARSLRSNKTGMIAVAIPSLENKSYINIAKGVQEIALKHNSMVFVVDTGTAENEESILQSLSRYNVDGLVITPSNTESEVLKSLSATIPTVFVGRKLEHEIANTSSVLSDNVKVTKSVIQGFIDNGHKKIASLCAPIKYSSGKARLNAYLDCLKENNIEVPENYHDNRCENFDEAYSVAVKMLSQTNRPTAIYCYSYYCGEALLKAARDLNLEVNKDIEIACIGDLEVNRILGLNLTIVEENMLDMGKKAGEIVFDMMADKTKVSNIVLKHLIRTNKK